MGLLDRISTLKALRYRNYRLYWMGLLVSIMGWQFLTFTQLWLVYELTGSTLYLGAVGGANGAATILLSLFGGVLADRVDKRRLIIFTQSIMAILALILATLAAARLVNVGHLLIIAALTGATSAFDNPARQALIPHLIDDPKDLPNAVALASSVWSATRAVGPALAGVLIASTNPAICFYITSGAYGVMVLALTRLSVGKLVVPQVRSSVLSAFKEGWRYVLSNKIFLNLITITFLNSIFGMSFVYLLPVFAKDILSAGPSGYGFLMTAFGIGAICGVVTVASVADRGHRGRVLLTGNFLFCLLLIVFSLSRWYSASLGLIAMAGFFNSIYMTNVITLLQTLVPNELRGRVMGIYSLTWSLMPLGGMQAGALANVLDVPTVVTIGGLVTLSFAVFAAISNNRIRNLD
ncbi:MAG: MFS transporter [Chloroflexota bacterium]